VQHPRPALWVAPHTEADYDTALKMSLSPGARLGPYEILAPLGAGGMGEVYRARDTRLGRAVAIKVLPGEFSGDPARLQRFRNEARAASALSHPNIVTIHEIGESDSTSFIVMELVEGKSLRELLAAGPLAPRKALGIAAQIADGLARAHAAGIIHRDLKPENVIVTPDGLVKILDFGLAKLLPGLSDLTQAIAQENVPTRPGMILGTVSYMSPEQARGSAVDFRSDQFALGATLYEMLTGQRAFHRETAAQTLAAIIEDDPEPVATLNPKVPVPLRWITERCLAKDPAERYASTFDLARDLANVRDHLSEIGAAPGLVAAPVPRSRARLARAAAWLVLGVALGLAGGFWLRPPPPQPPALRALTFSGQDYSPAASPDGRVIAFVSERDGTPRIWLKQIAGGSEAPLTAGPDTAPRFSPDGSEILFARQEGSGSSLYRVPVLGGEPRKILDNALEGDWSPDGSRIAFLKMRVVNGVREVVLGVVAADGSGAREVHTFENQTPQAPRWSPDGRVIAVVAVPYFGLGGSRAKGVRLIGLDGKEVGGLEPPSGGAVISGVAWMGSGNEAVYAQTESRAFALYETSSTSRVVGQEVGSSRARTLFWAPGACLGLDIIAPGRVAVDCASTRENLAEATLSAGARGPQPRWLTRGNSVDRQPIYSPDGQWIAFSSDRSGTIDLWALSLATGSIRQLTANAVDNWDPAFSPDGKKIFFSSNRTGHYEIWWANADGSDPRQLTHDGYDAENPTMTRDGKWVVYNSGSPREPGVWKIHPDGTGAAVLARGSTAWPEVSPDGAYALYTISGTEQSVVRVVRVADGQPVPFEIRAPGGSATVTRGAASGRARWLPNGRAIAFVAGSGDALKIFVQDFVPGKDTTATRRPLPGLDSVPRAESFAFSPDGERATVAAPDMTRTIYVADGVAGVTPPQRSR
jgi:eukaryotic-like serine/threonine-protein kinase